MTTCCDNVIIPDQVALKMGHGGLRYLELRHNGSEAHLYLHGAHVVHFQPAGESPVLWLSEASKFEPGTPIRGGIPVCWPWFGAHPNDSDQPAHGFARRTEWEPVRSSAMPTATSVTLALPAVLYREASLQLTVELSNQLSVTLTTTNTHDAELRFTEALHTYFSVQDIHATIVSGLEGQHYIDSLSPVASLEKQSGAISFTSETDRIYTNSTHDCTLSDLTLNRDIHIRKENSLSTVVWNPWIEKAARMPDFGDREFLEMVCVETANCEPNAVTLAPGQTHAMRLHISTQAGS